MIYFILCLLVVLMVVDFIKNKNIFSPGFIFNAIFFVTLFMYIFRLSYMQQELSIMTCVLLFICIVGYNLPVFIYYFAKDNTNKLVGISEKTENNKTKENIIKDITISPLTEYIIFAIVFIILIVEMILCKGFPLLWKFTGDTRVYVDFGVPLLHTFLYALTMLMGAYSLFKPKCYYKYFYLIVPILIISRQMLISLVIQGLILYCLRKVRLSKKVYLGIVIGAVLGISIFSVIGNFRTGASNFLNVARFKEQYDWIPVSIKWVYSYMCFSVSNLNNLVGFTPGFENYGASILNELLPSFLGFWFPTNFNRNYLIVEDFNVSTFAPSIYLDFGIIGCGIFCLIIGLVSTWLFSKIEKGNKIYILFYMIVIHNILLLFFSNMFFAHPIILEMLLVAFIFIIDYKKLGNKFNEKRLIKKGKHDVPKEEK